MQVEQETEDLDGETEAEGEPQQGSQQVSAAAKSPSPQGPAGGNQPGGRGNLTEKETRATGECCLNPGQP